ncbi:MAG TPA: DNA methyltransferase [Bryobacteraceae bacterium]|nr:DNA methyltransferase [Bryobacteraceae bacterium]
MPVYDSDRITLYQDDCRNVLPIFPAEMFDMVVTDPPYLVSDSGRWGSGHEIIEGDSDPSWVLPVFEQIARVLKPDSLCLTFYGWPHADIFFSAWKAVGLRPVSTLVFLKNRIAFGRFTRSQHELAYLLAKGSPAKPKNAVGDVLHWHQAKPQLHPHQKPLGAIGRIIGTYTDEDAVILDPFAGSGTTLLAARRLGRAAGGVEIDEGHCDTASLRLAQNMLPYLPPLTPEQLSLLDVIEPILEEPPMTGSFFQI